MSPSPGLLLRWNGDARAGAGHPGSVAQKQEVYGRFGAGVEESLPEVLLHITAVRHAN